MIKPIVKDVLFLGQKSGSAGTGGRIAAEQYYETLRTGPLKDCRPGLLHGKMKPGRMAPMRRRKAACR